MRGWLDAAVIAAAVLGGSAMSAQARTAPSSDLSVAVSGSLTYAWHGDPAHGCAAAGVCGISGAIIVAPDSGGGDLTVTGGQPEELGLGGGTITVRVQRPGADGAVSDCVESLDASDATIDFARPHPGGSAAGVAPLPTSHCATPLIGDLARLLLSARYRTSRPVAIDLRQRVTFRSGPYSGTLTSTIVTRPDTSFFSSGSSSESGPTTSPPTRRRRFEYVAMRYRATFPAEHPSVSFSGGSSGVCEIFDSCGVSGSTTLLIPATSLSVRVTASRAVRHPVSRARVLADLAAGRLTFDDPTYGSRGVRGVVTTDSMRNGLAGCNTTRAGIRLTLGASDYARGTFGRALVLFVDDATETGDALRAYCAGPTMSDVFGLNGYGDLLTGSLPLKALVRAQLAATMAAHVPYRAVPYSGRWEGTAQVILKRFSLSTGTRWEQVN